jgi:hypothetical protein
VWTTSFVVAAVALIVVAAVALIAVVVVVLIVVVAVVVGASTFDIEMSRFAAKSLLMCHITAAAAVAAVIFCPDISCLLSM